MGYRRRAYFAKADTALAVFAPACALLTFPHRSLRPQSPLHVYLSRLVPKYDWDYLPTTCMGVPYGPADSVRTELLLNLADDLFVFASGMVVLCSLAAALTGVRIARKVRPRSLVPWTLVAVILPVLTLAAFWRAVVLDVTRVSCELPGSCMIARP